MVVVLPGNRLVINDFFVESGTNCLMKYGNDVIQGQFISADGKEVGTYSAVSSSLCLNLKRKSGRSILWIFLEEVPQLFVP